MRIQLLKPKTNTVNYCDRKLLRIYDLNYRTLDTFKFSKLHSLVSTIVQIDLLKVAGQKKMHIVIRWNFEQSNFMKLINDPLIIFRSNSDSFLVGFSFGG